jgi:hypothetical protein
MLVQRHASALGFVAARCLSLGLWLLLCIAGPNLFAADKVTLEEPLDDVRVFGVGMRLDVNGKVVTKGERQESIDLPLAANATLAFRERRLVGVGSGAEAYRSVRDYEQAQVDISVGGEPTQVVLPAGLKLAVAQGRSFGAEVYSLGGALSAEELELLSPPTDSLALAGLLPLEPVAVGDTWTPRSWFPQFFTRLEAVASSEMSCQLASIDKEIAKISFQGKLKGAILGTTTDVQFTGTADFNLNLKAITGLSLEQVEQRSIGAVTAGLDVKARLRILRQPAQVPGRVAEPAILTAAESDAPPEALLLRFEAEHWSLLHPRSWHLFKHTEQVAIFRLLTDGLLVAQCNISSIPAVAAGQHTPAAEFERDIRQSIGSRLKTLSSAEELAAPPLTYLCKYVADGTVDTRSLTWIYYLCTAATGRQASMLFSLDANLREKLGTADFDLVKNLRFGPPAATAILKSTPRQ